MKKGPCGGNGSLPTPHRLTPPHLPPPPPPPSPSLYPPPKPPQWDFAGQAAYHATHELYVPPYLTNHPNHASLER
jgi:hypothetical protein